MSQTAVLIALNEEDWLHLKALGAYMEFTGKINPGPPKTWECYILETVYQQLKMYSVSGAPYGGMTLENFLRTINDNHQDGKCTTTNTTSST